jgi:hypothetical protein
MSSSICIAESASESGQSYHGICMPRDILNPGKLTNTCGSLESGYSGERSTASAGTRSDKSIQRDSETAATCLDHAVHKVATPNPSMTE